MKIAFVCKKRVDTYGKSFGLLNSAKFVSEQLNYCGYDSSVFSVVDANEIDRVVTQFDPKYVFIEALYITPAKFREILSIPRHKQRKQTTRIHSKLAFLANEGIALPWLKEYVSIAKEFGNLYVAPNTKELTSDLKSTMDLPIVYLPNIYTERSYDITAIKTSDKYTIDIGCFGAIRPMKNHLVQAVAAIKFAKQLGMKLNFHVNADRFEQRGDQVFKNLEALFCAAGDRYNLICHSWMCHEEFMNLISIMDMGMQVSLSESFNIVAADFVVSGIPIVVSNEISWVNGLFKVDGCASSDQIADKLSFTWRAKKYLMHYLNYIELYLYNRKARIEWLNFID